MSRVSQEELYNDKDVVTQILKLKDTVNDYAGGIIENIDVSGNDLVIDWASGESISLPLPSPTGISSVTGTVSGGNLTITFYMTDGSSHAFTCPLSGMASEAYVDGLDAQNVKLTGAQTVGGVKTFSDSPVVPDAPATEHSAVNQDWAENVAYPDDTVNNLIHKEGNETITGTKTFTSPVYVSRYSNQISYYLKCVNMEVGGGTNSTGCRINFIDKNDVIICSLRAGKAANEKVTVYAEVRNTDGTMKSVILAESDVI